MRNLIARWPVLNITEAKAQRALRSCPIQWFKHDTNASQDAKLQNVLLDYGLEGYGLYWYCIEMIAGKVDVNDLTFSLEHDARIIARNVGSTAQKVEEMMKYFVSIGLFECSNNTITCLKLAKRLDQSMTSNPKMRKLISEIKCLDNHDAIMTPSCKNRIEENRIDNNITTPDGDVTPPREAPKKPKSPNIDYSAIKEIWNANMTKAAKVTAITDKRKRAIKKLFDVFQLDLDKFENYVKYVNANPKCQWMFEEQDRGNGQVWQKKGFDYITSETCFLRVKEEY